MSSRSLSVLTGCASTARCFLGFNSSSCACVGPEHFVKLLSLVSAIGVVQVKNDRKSSFKRKPVSSLERVQEKCVLLSDGPGVTSPAVQCQIIPEVRAPIRGAA